MSFKLKCNLCETEAGYLTAFRGKTYYHCHNCQSVFMDPAGHLTCDAEKIRYDQHNNDVNDPGYQKFVKPLVEKVKTECNQNDKGLDYGAGPGPVAAVLLEESGYKKIKKYDPFYWPDHGVLQEKYNFIICCEVIEHFRSPSKNFSFLRSLLLPGGSLFCMTVLYDESIDFNSWYYKNDPTHVFFYHRKTLELIKRHFNFKDLLIENRLICLKL